MMNMYETWLIEELQNIDNFPYEDIKLLDKYPLEVSKQVLKVLIENSCLGQNYGPIELGRKKINEILISLQQNGLPLYPGLGGTVDLWQHNLERIQ